MANYTTSADLLDDILFRIGEATDGTSDYNAAAIRYLNRAYQALWGGGTEIDPNTNESWWWLRKSDPGVLTILPRVTGTASVTNNSTTVTLSVDPGTDLDDYRFKVDDFADVFNVSTHTTTAMVLDAVYTGPTNAAVAYTAFKNEYALASDFLDMVSPMRAFQNGRVFIDGISEFDLDRKWPLVDISSGMPKAFCMTGEREVRFSHYGGAESTDLIRLEYDYLAEPIDLVDDTASPVVPRKHRKILSDFATALLLADKDDDKAQAIFVLAQRSLLGMAKENRSQQIKFGRRLGKILPRQTGIALERGLLRTSSGLIIG